MKNKIIFLNVVFFTIPFAFYKMDQVKDISLLRQQQPYTNYKRYQVNSSNLIHSPEKNEQKYSESNRIGLFNGHSAPYMDVEKKLDYEDQDKLPYEKKKASDNSQNICYYDKKIDFIFFINHENIFCKSEQLNNISIAYQPFLMKNIQLIPEDIKDKSIFFEKQLNNIMDFNLLFTLKKDESFLKDRIYLSNTKNFTSTSGIIVNNDNDNVTLIKKDKPNNKSTDLQKALINYYENNDLNLRMSNTYKQFKDKKFRCLIAASNILKIADEIRNNEESLKLLRNHKILNLLAVVEDNIKKSTILFGTAELDSLSNLVNLDSLSDCNGSLRNNYHYIFMHKYIKQLKFYWIAEIKGDLSNLIKNTSS